MRAFLFPGGLSLAGETYVFVTDNDYAYVCDSGNALRKRMVSHER